MATILDVSLLEPFSFIFPVMIVWALVFSILQKTKAVTDSVGINAFVAAMVSFLVLLSETARDIISFMVPWFAVAIIFFILLILVFMVFGAKETDIFNAIKGDKAIIWTILGIILVIVLAAFANVGGQKLTEMGLGQGAVNATLGEGGVATPSYTQNLFATLFHPKVLGLIVLFAIIIFAILLLTG